MVLKSKINKEKFTVYGAVDNEDNDDNSSNYSIPDGGAWNNYIDLQNVGCVMKKTCDIDNTSQDVFDNSVFNTNEMVNPVGNYVYYQNSGYDDPLVLPSNFYSQDIYNPLYDVFLEQPPIDILIVINNGDDNIDNNKDNKDNDDNSYIINEIDNIKDDIILPEVPQEIVISDKDIAVSEDTNMCGVCETCGSCENDDSDVDILVATGPSGTTGSSGATGPSQPSVISSFTGSAQVISGPRGSLSVQEVPNSDIIENFQNIGRTPSPGNCTNYELSIIPSIILVLILTGVCVFLLTR